MSVVLKYMYIGVPTSIILVTKHTCLTGFTTSPPGQRGGEGGGERGGGGEAQANSTITCREEEEEEGRDQPVLR